MPKKSELLPEYSQKQNCDCSCCRKHRLQYEQGSNADKASEVANKLGQLPKVKARPGFSQKMLALFALELENETHQKNQSWLSRKKGVKLPGIRSDISKKLL